MLKGTEIKVGMRIAFIGLPEYQNNRKEGTITNIIDVDMGKCEVTWTKMIMNATGKEVEINKIQKVYIHNKGRKDYIAI